MINKNFAFGCAGRCRKAQEGAGRRRTAQDGVGRRRMAQDGAEWRNIESMKFKSMNK